MGDAPALLIESQLFTIQNRKIVIGITSDAIQNLIRENKGLFSFSHGFFSSTRYGV